MGRTRSGIQPDRARYQKFTIRTQQIKDYLQKKVDVLVDAMNKNGDPMPQMQIDLYSNYMSEKFVPLVLILEPTAAQSYYNTEDESIENDGEEIFNVNGFDDLENERVAEIKKPFAELFDSIKYTKKDLSVLRSSAYKREMRLNNVNTKAIHHFSVPRFYTIKGSDGVTTTRIVMVVDPIKILFDMLVEDRDKNFYIKIWVEKKINDSEYEYKIEKIPNKKRKRDANREFKTNLKHRLSTFTQSK